MKHVSLASAALLLVACGGDSAGVDTSDDPVAASGTAPVAAAPQADADVVDGQVTLTVDRVIEETDPDNCLLMMSVRNGTDDTVSAGLFAFDVEGAGETAGANMFPQTAAPGETKTAQIILPGRDCAVAETITSGQPACMIDGTESCVDALVLADGEVDFALDTDAAFDADAAVDE